MTINGIPLSLVSQASHRADLVLTSLKTLIRVFGTTLLFTLDLFPAKIDLLPLNTISMNLLRMMTPGNLNQNQKNLSPRNTDHLLNNLSALVFNALLLLKALSGLAKALLSEALEVFL
jgi:hypothetical protein